MSYIAITKLFSPVSNRDKFRVLIFALVFVLDKDILAQRDWMKKSSFAHTVGALCEHKKMKLYTYNIYIYL